MDKTGTKGLTTCKICYGRAVKTQYLIGEAKVVMYTVKCIEDKCQTEYIVDAKKLSEMSKINQSKGNMDH